MPLTLLLSNLYGDREEWSEQSASDTLLPDWTPVCICVTFMLCNEAVLALSIVYIVWCIPPVTVWPVFLNYLIIGGMSIEQSI